MISVLQAGRHLIDLEDRLLADAPIINIDHELQAGQAHATVRDLGEFEGQLWLPTFIMIFTGMSGRLPMSVGYHFEVQLATAVII